jgi:Spy/CpxP family protein refolding chaperone
MKKLFCACLTMLLLMIAAPVLAQEIDLDDEDMIFFVADMSAADPPDNAPAVTGQPQPMAGPHKETADHQGWGKGGHGRWGGIAAFLNLSRDQIAKMRDIHNRYYLDTRSLRYDLMQQRLEMRRLFLDPKVDSAALLAKHRELNALRQRLTDAMASLMIDWRAILTPEQITKLDMAVLARGAMGYGMGAGMGPGMMGQGMMGDGR